MNAHIEKLVFGGQALGKTDDGKIAFVWNALPGEDVELDVIKNKKNLVEANALRIIKSSETRIPPEEKHYLSCSPWQIMPFAEENRWKVAIAKETYQKIGGLQTTDIDIIADERAQYRYRNKIEYSFVETDFPSPVRGGLGRGISLAFFERGRRYRLPIEHCVLASASINETAHLLLDWINEQKIPLRSLKTMILRSNEAGHTIAGLFIKDKLKFTNFPKLSAKTAGFQLYYSTHKSPASVPTELLHAEGVNYIEETVRKTKLRYGLLSFFQINVPIFSLALEDIAKHLTPGTPLLDYYSGVGSIGLPLAHKRPSCTLVELNDEAVMYAKENIKENGYGHVNAILAPAERALTHIKSDVSLIVDPPREGLHQDVVKRILETTPEQVIYLSCNLSTHARDIALLKEKYNITFLKIYNFFPRTPHIEGLCILKRK